MDPHPNSPDYRPPEGPDSPLPGRFLDSQAPVTSITPEETVLDNLAAAAIETLYSQVPEAPEAPENTSLRALYQSVVSDFALSVDQFSEPLRFTAYQRALAENTSPTPYRWLPEYCGHDIFAVRMGLEEYCLKRYWESHAIEEGTEAFFNFDGNMVLDDEGARKILRALAGANNNLFDTVKPSFVRGLHALFCQRDETSEPLGERFPRLFLRGVLRSWASLTNHTTLELGVLEALKEAMMLVQETIRNTRQYPPDIEDVMGVVDIAFVHLVRVRNILPQLNDPAEFDHPNEYLEYINMEEQVSVWYGRMLRLKESYQRSRKILDGIDDWFGVLGRHYVLDDIKHVIRWLHNYIKAQQ